MPRKKASKSTAKGSTTKKKSPEKLNELNQAHGKVEGPEPTTLDQIWGDSGLSKYRTLDASEYEIYLNNLIKAIYSVMQPKWVSYQWIAEKCSQIGS